MKIVLIATLILFSSISFAKSYQCKNSKGVLVSQDTPCKNAHSHSSESKATKKHEHEHVDPDAAWKAQEGKMSFWSESIPLSDLYALIADFARVKLEIDPAITKPVNVRYEEKTHWKQLAKEVAAKHNLKITITDKLIKVSDIKD